MSVSFYQQMRGISGKQSRFFRATPRTKQTTMSAFQQNRHHFWDAETLRAGEDSHKVSAAFFGDKF